MYKIFQTSKNKEGIIYKNYYYYFKRINKSDLSRYYKCRIENCSASITIGLGGEILRATETHSHDPVSDLDIDIRSAISQMKLDAERTGASCLKIYEDTVLKIAENHSYDEIAKNMPEFTSVSTALYLHKRKRWPPLPTSLADMNVTGNK